MLIALFFFVTLSYHIFYLRTVTNDYSEVLRN